MTKKYLFMFLSLIAAAACVTTPISQRQALVLIPFSQEVALGAQAYEEILKKEKASHDTRLIEIINRVGKQLAAVSAMPNLAWEFKVIESKQKNAFALPGGKVAVYTGILPVCANEAGLATVMGHEIAHAIARHGAQRMTQQLLLTGALTVASVGLADNKNRNLLMAALGLGAMVGITLPYSRMNESEADEIGLVYMARAGYDPQEAIRFWQRFDEEKKGNQVPDFLSTHPSDTARIINMQNHLSSAAAHYASAPNKHGAGESFK